MVNIKGDVSLNPSEIGQSVIRQKDHIRADTKVDGERHNPLYLGEEF